MNRCVFFRSVIPVITIIASAVVPRGIHAQQSVATGGTGGRDALRYVIIQAGTGVTVPLMHLGASDDIDDGYARPHTMLIFRAYIPFMRKIDLMVDLALPRFKVDEQKYEKNTRTLIDEAFYKGKILSLGARWFPFANPFKRGFVMASAGMYQLIWDRFLNGGRDIYTVINGAYKLGGAVGGGLEFKLGDVMMDGVLRYHHYMDACNFGEGNLSWLEIGLQVTFGGRL
ncbi:MAG: hypothetical protein KAT18_07620 [Candidatus Latescibacteria bacterium]|nr:hypothetical protein [Candidatus Latescibacterota bacterium]